MACRRQNDPGGAVAVLLLLLVVCVSGGGSSGMGRVTHNPTLCVPLILPANTALARFHHESAMK